MRLLSNWTAGLVLTLSVVVIGTATGCATNPVTGGKQFTMMSEADEIRLGQEYDAQVRHEMGVYDDPQMQRYIEDVGMRLARNSQRPNLPWSFAIVDVAAVNAFALPGGFIYLSRGILPYLNDESELAGVLGHEIGHVAARHSVAQDSRAAAADMGLNILSIFFPASRPFGGLASTGLGFLLLKNSRDAELQADRLGAEYLAQNEYDPNGVPRLLTTLARITEVSDRRGVPNWLQTHPQAEDRVTKVAQTVADLSSKAAATQARNQDDFLSRLDGVMFGDDPREGVVRGNLFLHPEMRFAVEFPEGWDVNNGKEQVAARQPGENAFLVLTLAEIPRGRDLEGAAAFMMQRNGLRRRSGALTTINGLDAFVGDYEGNVNDVGRATVHAAHFLDGRRVFMLAGVASTEAYGRFAPEFQRTIQSFRPLSRREAQDIRPNLVDIYTVRAGDSWQSIAQRNGHIVKASTLAILNGRAVVEQPEVGERIKIIVAG